MMQPTLEQIPIRGRDVGTLGKVLAGALGGALTVGAIVLGIGAWKGQVDEQIKGLTGQVTALQTQQSEMVLKIDRLSETLARVSEVVENRK